MSELYKQLGTIKVASFGIGGYENSALGITFVLGNDSWSVQDFWGQVSRETAHLISLESAFGVIQLLKDGGVTRIEDLVGTPVEITLTGIGGRLKSWRVVKPERPLTQKFKEVVNSFLEFDGDFDEHIETLVQITKEHYEKEDI